MRLKGRVGGSSNQRRGPLRRIVKVLTFADSLFDQARVLLECGHKVASAGAYKARCRQCALAMAGEPKPGEGK